MPSTLERDITTELDERAARRAEHPDGYVVLVIAEDEAMAIRAAPLVAAHMHSDRLYRDVVYVEPLGTAYEVIIREDRVSTATDRPLPSIRNDGSFDITMTVSPGEIGTVTPAPPGSAPRRDRAAFEDYYRDDDPARYGPPRNPRQGDIVAVAPSDPKHPGIDTHGAPWPGSSMWKRPSRSEPVYLPGSSLEGHVESQAIAGGPWPDATSPPCTCDPDVTRHGPHTEGCPRGLWLTAATEIAEDRRRLGVPADVPLLEPKP